MGDAMTHDVPDPLVEFQLLRLVRLGGCEVVVRVLGGGWDAAGLTGGH